MTPENDFRFEDLRRPDSAAWDVAFGPIWRELLQFLKHLNYDLSEEDREDIAQEVINKRAVQAAAEVASVDEWKAYLFTAAKHHAINYLKAKNRQKRGAGMTDSLDALAVEKESDELDPAAKAQRAEIGKDVEDVLRTSSAREKSLGRAILLMEMKQREAAQQLGISTKSVGSTMTRLLEKLRSRLHWADYM